MPDIHRRIFFGFSSMMKTLLRNLTVLILVVSPSLAGDADLLVKVVTVESTALTFDTTLTGSIEAQDSVNLGFRQGGRVIEVMVNEGDQVRRGQPLARTDATQQQQALKVAEAAVESAQSAQRQRQLAFDRASTMLTRGVGTRAALDNAAQALSSAKGALAQSQTTLEQARRAVEDTVIRAPDDAVVTARNVNPGQIAAAAQPMISLAETKGLEAVFATPDMPLLQDAIGVAVSITGLDTTTPDMQATIGEISPLVDPQTGAVAVRAYIIDPPPDSALLGAAVRGTAHFPAGTGIQIPKSALSATAAGPSVWLVDPDMRVRLTPIAIARFTTDDIVVSEGIKPGDQVVTSGAQLLYPGRRVTTLADKATGQDDG